MQAVPFSAEVCHNLIGHQAGNSWAKCKKQTPLKFKEAKRNQGESAKTAHPLRLSQTFFQNLLARARLMLAIRKQRFA